MVSKVSMSQLAPFASYRERASAKNNTQKEGGNDLLLKAAAHLVGERDAAVGACGILKTLCVLRASLCEVSCIR